jgi:uncharacterized membrane protein YbhN (UPF0104 family)
VTRAKVARRTTLVVLGSIAGFALLAVVLGGRWTELTHAMAAAPLGLIALAALLQLGSLLARSEAWNRCVRSAGGTIERRKLFQVASIGYLGNIVNGELGFAVRIAALRKAAPKDTPKLGALAVSEVPILLVEAALAALVSFTLVGPLGLPWWLPIAAFAGMAGLGLGLRRVALRRGLRGWWGGLSVLHDPPERVRMAAFILLAMIAQILRNWLMLYAVGIEVSLFDATAVLIATAVLGALPLGPSVGASACVLILGAHGVAGVAGAGLLLTATGAIGAIGYAAWALADHLWDVRGRLHRHQVDRVRTRRAQASAGAMQAILTALPARRRANVESTYFGGITHEQLARILFPYHGAGARRLEFA